MYEIDAVRVTSVLLGPRCGGDSESSGEGPPGQQTGDGTCVVVTATCAGRSPGAAECTRVSAFARLHVLRVYKTPEDRPGR